MMSEIKRMSASVREGYQILLRAEAEIELPLQLETIRSYYLTLAEKCMTWATEVHGELLRKTFIKLDDIHEKSLFRTQKYRFSERCVWESGTHIAILCESFLSGQRGEHSNSYYRMSHVWNVREHTVLPMQQVWQLFGRDLRPKDLPFVPDGIYPMGEQLIFYKNSTSESAFLQEMSPMEKP